MPTSADYLGWATSLEGLADDLADDDQRLLTAWDAGPVVGGELAGLTHRAVEAAGDNVAAVRTELYRLRAECEDRAQVCADYATALGRYSAAYDRYLVDLRRARRRRRRHHADTTRASVPSRAVGRGVTERGLSR